MWNICFVLFLLLGGVVSSIDVCNYPYRTERLASRYTVLLSYRALLIVFGCPKPYSNGAFLDICLTSFVSLEFQARHP